MEYPKNATATRQCVRCRGAVESTKQRALQEAVFRDLLRLREQFNVIHERTLQFEQECVNPLSQSHKGGEIA